ncbi:alpha/beta-hydrolase family protein [Streptomyces sp. H27-H1]|uniref:alpha/beta-hydrolase family protein n=1 Tax=Streptomyces sp. H27-H1 TaxID=2996461 RepID=UPI003B63B588
MGSLGVSVLTEDEAAAASRALFGAVYDKWRTLPAGTRPRLLACSPARLRGESGFLLHGDRPRRDPDRPHDKTDGALFVGPTYATP